MVKFPAKGQCILKNSLRGHLKKNKNTRKTLKRSTRIYPTEKPEREFSEQQIYRT